MAKTKSKAKSKRNTAAESTVILPAPVPTPPPAPPATPRGLQWLFRPWRLALAALVLTGTVVGPRLVRHVQPYFPDLSEREEYQLRTLEMEITPPPHWVPHDILDQVIERAQLPETVSLLDDRLTKTVAEAFGMHPWIAKVERVTKSVPSTVRVELLYRRPVAMVQVEQGLYPVDAAGVLLPPADFSVAEAKRYPLIVRARSTPQGPAGTSWGDETVIGGAKLADILRPNWKEFNLVSIEIPNAAESSSDDVVYGLRTVGGSRVIWGRAPGSTHPGELTSEQKIGRMEEYVSRFGGFDQPNGPYLIDIRHWQEITRRPLALGDSGARY